MTQQQAFGSTMIPGCRWDYRRFVRAQRAYRAAAANLDTIVATLTANGVTLDWAARNDPEYITALVSEAATRAEADRRRDALLTSLKNMDRPDVIGDDPARYLNTHPEVQAPYTDPVPLPPGVTEEMDERDYAPPAIAERCGAPSKNFARYGYCDRYASKDGWFCYQHG